MRPKVFISCSQEGAVWAENVQYHLSEIAEPHIWNQNLFSPPGAIKDSDILDWVKRYRDADFAFFFACPQDINKMEAQPELRDQFIFWLGLAMGQMSKMGRVFCAIPQDTGHNFLNIYPDQIKIYRYNGVDNSPAASIRAFSDDLSHQIEKAKSEIKSVLPDVKEKQEATDLEVRYLITLNNWADDSILAKTVRFVADEDVIRFRSHFIYSDSEATDIGLKAWTQDHRYKASKKHLSIDLQSESPQKKMFTIDLAQDVKQGESFEYTYECQWKGMFQSVSDFIVLRNTALKLQFGIIAPDNRRLQPLRVFEKMSDRLQINDKIRYRLVEDPIEFVKEGISYRQYNFELLNFTIHAETRIDWSFN